VEFAIVVADAWQGRGLGRALLERLIAARERGYARMVGSVLAMNATMLSFVKRLGFASRRDPTITSR